MLTRILIFLLFFCAAYESRANGYNYDYNENCRLAYQNFMSLHMDEGRRYVSAALKADPYNLMAIYVSDYEDCIELLINCDNTELELRREHFDEHLKLLDKGDKTSPWYLFCKAGIYVHWAIVNVRFGEQYEAAMNFHRSFSLLEENQRLFPAFEYNHVFTGLEQAIIGSLPGSYKWIASMFGMKGDIKKGTARLTTFINTHTNAQPIYTETVLYYLFARFYLLSEQKEVWNFLNTPEFTTSDNLLYAFAKVNIALDYRKSDAAIETLHGAEANPDYKKYAVFDYQMGVALLTKLDTTATFYFHQYLKKTKSNIYIKDSWQKIAFAWYTNNNMAKATYSMDQVRTRGTARLDADKQAYRFSENESWPMINLLQARLLIDGGYNDAALTILKSIDPSTIKNPADKAEYFYRSGRAYQDLADNNGGKQYFQLALDNYGKTVTAGKGRREQFAARAALQTAKMYEQQGLNAEAVKMYKECLDMPAHDFQNSIDQQAKAGINRVEGK